MDLLDEDGQLSCHKLMKIWMDAKEAILDFAKLKPAGLPDYYAVENGDVKNWAWYFCPGGCTEHLAILPYLYEGLSKQPCDVLTCYGCHKQWAIRHPDVAAVLYDGEARYFKLLEKAPAIVRKVVKKRGWSEETILFLDDTHGIEREVSEAVMDGTWPED